MIAEPQGVVIGNRHGLTQIAAGLFTLVERDVLALPVLPLAGQIRTAIEQVVVDAKFDAGVVTRTGVELIAVAVATGDEIESRHERSAPPFQIELCRLGIFDGGA